MSQIRFFNRLVFLALIVLIVPSRLYAQELPLPKRDADALSGQEVYVLVENMVIEMRETELLEQINSGNIPNFLRELVPVSIERIIGDSLYQLTYFVLPDYFAIGSDLDYFLIPTTPDLAQTICNLLNFVLPTRLMADQIWQRAEVKLRPLPIAPTPQMTTIPVMWQHNLMVKAQRDSVLSDFPLGRLTVGHKKDVIISNRIYGNKSLKRVVIYGWHHRNGTPIQPVFAGHKADYADYSHGIRLIQNKVYLNGRETTIQSILKDSTLAPLISDEGVITKPFYPLDVE